MNTQEVMEAARAMIAEKWNQGSYGNRIDGYCIVGALSECAVLNETDGQRRLPAAYRSAYAALERHLPEFGFVGHYDLPTFNDDVNTTQEMVLALFDKALADETIE